MTVKEYIRQHPKSFLAIKLARRFGINSRKQIHLGSGIISTYNKGSNISKLMIRTGSNGYEVGGKAGQRASQGSFFAVFRK